MAIKSLTCNMTNRWLTPEAIAEHQARMAKLGGKVRTVRLLEARKPPLPKVPPKTTRRKGVHRWPTEHESQVAVIQWFDLKCKSFGLPPFALFAVPNSGAGGQSGRAGWLKAEGVRAGVADLFLAVARRDEHGLFLEMKSKGGRTSAEQGDFGFFVAEQQYHWALCFSTEEAIREIEKYLTRAQMTSEQRRAHER